MGGSQKLGKAARVSKARLALALPTPLHFLFQAKQTVFVFGKFPNLISFLGPLLPFPSLFSLAMIQPKYKVKNISILKITQILNGLLFTFMILIICLGPMTPARKVNSPPVA